MAAPSHWWQLPMPPNWEAKFDPGQNRYFFINHSTKTTSWEDPRIKMFAERQQQQQAQHSAAAAAHTSSAGQVTLNFGGGGASPAPAAAGWGQHAQASPHRSPATTGRSPAAQPRQPENIPMTSLGGGGASGAAGSWQQQVEDKFGLTVKMLADDEEDEDDEETSALSEEVTVDKDTLAKLKRMFPAAEEWAVRKALARSNNSEGAAITDLERSGYKRQDVPHQMQDTVVVNRLKKEFPSAEEGVIRDVVQCVNRDESRARSELKALGYASHSRSSTPQRAPSPRRPTVTEADKAQRRAALVREFADLPPDMVDVALSVVEYDLDKARGVLKGTAGTGAAAAPKTQTSASRSAAATSDPDPAPTLTTTAPALEMPKFNLDSFSGQDSRPSVSTSSGAPSLKEYKSTFGKQKAPASSITSRLKSTNKSAIKSSSRARAPAVTADPAVTSAHRTPTQGPNPELPQGHDKDLLIAEYTASQGPQREHRCGPARGLACGPAGRDGPDPSLPSGPDRANHAGPDPGAAAGASGGLSGMRPMETVI